MGVPATRTDPSQAPYDGTPTPHSWTRDAEERGRYLSEHRARPPGTRPRPGLQLRRGDTRGSPGSAPPKGRKERDTKKTNTNLMCAGAAPAPAARGRRTRRASLST